MQIAEGVSYIGVNDHQIDYFESQFAVPNGMAYNSYVVASDKIAVMDSVEASFGDEWLAKLDAILAGRMPDYLVVHHMEPDHSANVAVFMDRYPAATVVASIGAFNMMRSYFGTAYEDRRMVVKEGDVLDLGGKHLSFIAAPLVHWPEVMFSYDEEDGLLFSADAFGKFGALDVDEPWDDEARRYYFGIVGKFGANVQKVLSKVAQLDVQAICSLHGPVLSQDLGHYLDLYQTWSSYEAEAPGVTIAYTSVYGHVRKAVELLAQRLGERGCPSVSVYDLARDDASQALADAFRRSCLVLATTTYNGGIFPAMHDFASLLADHAFQARTVGLMEGGSWMPAAAKGLRAALEPCRGLSLAESVVTVKGSLDDASLAQLDALVDELMASL